MRKGIPKNKNNSREFKSWGSLVFKEFEKPNIKFIQLRKKKVGPKRYRKTSKKIVSSGKRSNIKEKNKNSDTKNIEPGKPKNMRVFKSIARNNLGHKKFIPFISVISLDLNLLETASTSRKEFVDKSAWLINIQKLASIRFDWPLTTQIVNQCISTTVE
jgi:hypothetical protein